MRTLSRRDFLKGSAAGLVGAALSSAVGGTFSLAALAEETDYWANWGDIDTSEHVVINYMTTGDKPSGESLDNLNAILTEKVNAEIEIYYIE